MIYHNFKDAISEGDGERIIRCWKFFLPYLKADGAASRKYCLEGLHLLLQVNCLSETESQRLIWNRSVKSKSGPGGNIPIDLAMEHYIRIIKLIKRRLGPNQSNPNNLQRYVKALVFTKAFLDNFDQSCHIIKKSGKNFKKSAVCDKTKVINELVKEGVFKKKQSRNIKSSFISNFPNSLLKNFNLHEFYL